MGVSHPMLVDVVAQSRAQHPVKKLHDVIGMKFHMVSDLFHGQPLRIMLRDKGSDLGHFFCARRLPRECLVFPVWTWLIGLRIQSQPM